MIDVREKITKQRENLETIQATLYSLIEFDESVGTALTIIFDMLNHDEQTINNLHQHKDTFKKLLDFLKANGADSSIINLINELIKHFFTPISSLGNENNNSTIVKNSNNTNETFFYITNKKIVFEAYRNLVNNMMASNGSRINDGNLGGPLDQIHSSILHAMPISSSLLDETQHAITVLFPEYAKQFGDFVQLIHGQNSGKIDSTSHANNDTTPSIKASLPVEKTQFSTRYTDPSSLLDTIIALATLDPDYQDIITNLYFGISANSDELTLQSIIELRKMAEKKANTDLCSICHKFVEMKTLSTHESLSPPATHSTYADLLQREALQPSGSALVEQTSQTSATNSNNEINNNNAASNQHSTQQDHGEPEEYSSSKLT